MLLKPEGLPSFRIRNENVYIEEISVFERNLILIDFKVFSLLMGFFDKSNYKHVLLLGFRFIFKYTKLFLRTLTQRLATKR